MFWKTQTEDYGITNLLNKENVCLQELLEDPYILQELKCSNQRLIDYLKRPEVLIELAKLSLSEPPDVPTEDVSKKYRFSHLSTEVLSTDSELVTVALSENEQCFDILRGFVKTRQTLNPLLASSFAKILSLLGQRFPARTLSFMQNHAEFLDDCLHHLETFAIADALFRLCACIENEEEATKIRIWLCEMNFVSKLIDNFNRDQPEEACVNATFLLTELVRCLRDALYSRDDKTLDPLLSQLQSKSNLEMLLTKMFALPRCSSVLVNGCIVFSTLLQTLPSSFNLLEMNFSKPLEVKETQWTPDPENVAVSCLVEKLADFAALIAGKTENAEAIELPMGTMKEPFGSDRLAALKLVVQLTTCDSLAVHKRLFDLNISDTVFDCFFNYPYNNFLHSCASMFVFFVLNLKLTSLNDKESSPVLKQFFNEGKLLKLILENVEKMRQSKKRSTNYGHLLKIAEYVNRSISSGVKAEVIKNILNDLQPEYLTSWSKFVEDVLNPYLKVNEPDAIVFPSSGLMDVLSREDFPPLTSESQHTNQLFVEYQSQQMTEAFTEPSVFTPDNFMSDHQDVKNINASMSSAMDISIKKDSKEKLSLPGEKDFESLCNQRINTMDDDDDMFPEREITFDSSIVSNAEKGEDSGAKKSLNAKEKLRLSTSSSDEEDDGCENATKMDFENGPGGGDWAAFPTNESSSSSENWADV